MNPRQWLTGLITLTLIHETVWSERVDTSIIESGAIRITGLEANKLITVESTTAEAIATDDYINGNGLAHSAVNAEGIYGDVGGDIMGKINVNAVTGNAKGANAKDAYAYADTKIYAYVRANWNSPEFVDRVLSPV